MTLRLLDAGDAAFKVEFGETIAPALLAAEQALDAGIARAQAAGALPGLIETMPTFRSLTVFFDPLRTGRAELIEALQPLFKAAEHAPPVDGRHWRLPVCYEGVAGPDLAATPAAAGLSPDEVVALHSGTEFRVYMLGFMPGFPFMGDLPERLRLARRTEPRVRVPAGSVAIAVHRCPLKEAWTEAGLSPADMQRMCRIAGRFDNGCFGEAGIGFEAKTWKPGQDGCCTLTLRPR